MGVTEFIVVVELQKVRTKCISSDFWDRTGASLKMGCIRKGEESNEKIRFYRIYLVYHG